MDAELKDPKQFRAAFFAVDADERERWFNGLLALEELPLDEESLPRGCVPYLPSALEVLVQAIELASISAEDTFVDLGSGLGRALCFVHLMTGARAIGLEIQPGLVARARELSARLGLDQVSTALGDASELIEPLSAGSVYFLYCPFQGERLERVMGVLERRSAVEQVRVCTADMPLMDRPGFELKAHSGSLLVYSLNSLSRSELNREA